MKLEFSRQIFEKWSNVKFHENPSSGSRVVPIGQTWRSWQSLFVIFPNARGKKIKLAQERVQTRSLVNTALHQRIQQLSGDFLNSLRDRQLSTKRSSLFIAILFTEKSRPRKDSVSVSNLLHTQSRSGTSVFMPQVKTAISAQQRKSIKFETAHIRTSGTQQVCINHEGLRSEDSQLQPEELRHTSVDSRNLSETTVFRP